MEVSSPAFSTANRVVPRPTPEVSRRGKETTSRAPEAGALPARFSFPLPLRFIVIGLISLLLGTAWLLIRPILLAGYHYSPEVIALTHLVVLGGVTSIVMGAMYQLVPVALETALHSERLVRWQFALHVIGFTGMVIMFSVWNIKQVGHFASFFALSVGLLIYNLVRTLRRVPRWNVVATGIASSLGWLGLTVLAGLFLASAKCWPQISPLAPLSQMHAHAHLGVVGVFLLLIMAVSYKLIPMFTLGDAPRRRPAAASIWLVNAGLAGLVPTVALDSPWKLLFAAVLIVGLGVYGFELAALLRSRRRRVLDWGLKCLLTALGLLAPLSLLAVILCWPTLRPTPFTAQLENVYGFVGIVGVVIFAILGMLCKILPFLVWTARYSEDIGRRQVPALSDLRWAPLEPVAYGLYLAGIAITSIAIAVASETGSRCGMAFIFAALLAFAINAAVALSHLLRPRLEPCPRASTKGNLS